jgi:hypothetical protein
MLRWITALLTATVGGCSGASTRHVAHGSRAHDHGHGARGEGSSEHAFVDADSWTGIFDDPARDSWQRPDDVLGALELEPGMTVADVGAGTGYFAVRLARALPRGEVIATDLEADMVRFVNGPCATRAARQSASRTGYGHGSRAQPRECRPNTHRARVASPRASRRVRTWSRGGASTRRASAGRRVQPHGSPGSTREPSSRPGRVVAELAAAGLSASVSPTGDPRPVHRRRASSALSSAPSD